MSLYCERYHGWKRISWPHCKSRTAKEKRKRAGGGEHQWVHTHKHGYGPQNTGESCRTRNTRMLKGERSMEMMTLQPKNRLKGENGHDRRTPQKVEKGTGDPLNASLPAQRKQPHMAVLHHRDLLQDGVAEPPGMGGLKFRKKRENMPSKGLKDQVFRKLLSHHVSGQGENRESIITAPLILFFPSSPSICC